MRTVFNSRAYALSSCLLASAIAQVACLPSPSHQTLHVKRDAQCGPNTPSGAQTCGMGLCCSVSGYCGATSDYCDSSSCQSGFGQCKVAVTPSCSAASGSASKKTIGYWSSVNTQRNCDTVTPAQIVTTGLTHLYYAFVTFDDASFAIQDTESDTYTAFTARQSSSLQTWVAIGGGSVGGAPWTKMISTTENRAAFIWSLKLFTRKYGFQGVDLDWEFPGPGDAANFVSLVQEMRTSFGPSFGISLTIPSDIGTEVYFDAKGMEPYVDSFGFMAYDQNTGSSVVHGHTDIADIEAGATAIYASGIDMSKVVLGLAYYGRGFTLADASCAHEGCAATQAIQNGACTASGGESVLSLAEIKDVIKAKSLTPSIVDGAMYKQIVWDGQWMGYDDEETIALKKSWASGKCFGGTMIWTTDFYNHGAI